MQRALKTLFTLSILVAVTHAANEADAGTGDEAGEAFKVNIGSSGDLIIHASMGDSRVSASGLLPLVDVGLGMRLSEHTLVAAQASAAFFGWRAGAETRWSLRGFSKIGPVFWGGIQFADMAIDCGSIECASDEHFGPETWARGTMLSVGAGYQWPFDADSWAVMVGVGNTASYLRGYTTGSEALSDEAADAIDGWYTGIPMLRIFVEY